MGNSQCNNNDNCINSMKLKVTGNQWTLVHLGRQVVVTAGLQVAMTLILIALLIYAHTCTYIPRKRKNASDVWLQKCIWCHEVKKMHNVYSARQT